MNTNKISSLSKIILVISSILLIASLFVPIWQIDLDAPQYPEGLNMKIYANKVGGDVDIINGLNHYIGMKTIHNDDFVEFKVLPYIVSFFALFAFLVAIIGRKKVLYLLLTMFILFGILAMYDFWKWEYDYGHNLNPDAAIIVPGMTYQPPLIGFKQLLNFGAYSIPDIGGWLFIGSGFCMVLASLIELNVFKKFTKKPSAIIALFAILLLSSCSDNKPEFIKLNQDNCDYCKMTIASGNFASEIKTKKGRAYKFDDISCLVGYLKENTKVAEGATLYINDYLSENNFIDVNKAFFIAGENIGSPMGGNIAAFTTKELAMEYLQKLSAKEITWSEINK